ncbi:MAG: sensor histidine kinase [Verrucomicrobiota bacterium]
MAYALATASGKAESPLPPFIQTVEEVRSLSYETAKSGPPVQLEVIVISHLHAGFDGQDETGGLFFECQKPPPVGTLVEVTGKVTGGMYEPYVVVDDTIAKGTRPHPEPLKWLPEHLQSGVGDNRWIELEGILVQTRIRPPKSHWAQAKLIAGTVEIGIRFRNRQMPFSAEELRALSGAKVRIRGSGAPLFNHSHQRIGSELICPDLNLIEILQPAEERFELPITPLAKIRSWNYRQDSPGLVRTLGVVTFADPGADLLVIQEGERGSLIRTAEDFSAVVGDTVEVIGFPESLGFFVGLRFAEVVGSEAKRSIQSPLQISNPLTNKNPFELITLKGRLVEKTGQFCSLQTGDNDLVAIHGPLEVIARLPEMGSVIQVTGVKFVEATQNGDVRSVAVEMRSTSDLTVLKTPSWWTPARYLSAIAVLGCCIVAALGWNVLLKRQVRTQTSQIHSQVATNAALEERNRIARELHDTLSQGFAGVAYQLSSVRNHIDQRPERAHEKLDQATHMVEQSLAEARNALSELRSPILNELSLGQALQTTANTVCEAGGVDLQVKIQDETIDQISKSTQHEILRIVLEAISNAVNHAQAGLIQLSLLTDSRTLRAEVTDNGQGFDPELAFQGGNQFGIRGMHERAQRIGAELTMKSMPRSGTTMTLTLPL